MHICDTCALSDPNHQPPCPWDEQDDPRTSCGNWESIVTEPSEDRVREIVREEIAKTRVILCPQTEMRGGLTVPCRRCGGNGYRLETP